MCGIVGIVSKSAASPTEEALQGMMKAIPHRGPDGVGQHLTDRVAFGQVRLAIIDLEGGKQPLYLDDMALVANGEIYNYRELSKKFDASRFSTASDCELPLHLYERDGLSFPESLRGMYALALHDPAFDRVVLMRDPYGIKPLYYIETESFFLFASEIQALFASGLVEPTLNRQAVTELFQFQFTIGVDTAFEGVKRVMPGEMLVIEQGRIISRDIFPPFEAAPPISISESEALTQLDKVLMESVEMHQRADVPYGMFLSGGVDSAILLKVMERLNPNPVKAFTAGFPGTGVHDERAHARALAKSVGAEHIELSVTEEDFWAHLPQIVASIDDPVADYAIVPSWLLAQKAREHVKVILSGEGGDELFAGYGRYRSAVRPYPFRRRMRRKGRFDGLGILRTKNGWRDNYALTEKNGTTGLTRLQNVQLTDCADWLPHDLLIKQDRCLMAHGIEGRVPLLDPVVGQFAFQLPDHLKLHGRKGKWLLRSWLARHFPESDPFARKRGFTVPVADWIAEKGPELGALVAEQPGIQEFCHVDSVKAAFANPADKSGIVLWTLLYFALWHQRHMRGVSGGSVFDVLAERS